MTSPALIALYSIEEVFVAKTKEFPAVKMDSTGTPKTRRSIENRIDLLIEISLSHILLF